MCDGVDENAGAGEGARVDAGAGAGMRVVGAGVAGAGIARDRYQGVILANSVSRINPAQKAGAKTLETK